MNISFNGAVPLVSGIVVQMSQLKDDAWSTCVSQILDTVSKCKYWFEEQNFIYSK